MFLNNSSIKSVSRRSNNWVLHHFKCDWTLKSLLQLLKPYFHFLNFLICLLKFLLCLLKFTLSFCVFTNLVINLSSVVFSSFCVSDSFADACFTSHMFLTEVIGLSTISVNASSTSILCKPSLKGPDSLCKQQPII
ncbi:unnamed protein product [Moneuplotes crassus]|uniref:Uncharacterized protein n=1 Tax=Euplotes crassus TaxID=5936 RepID=A0AAD1XY22_EUPCR|nr:unnamed protein product [Moneuplotes crassus]